MSVGIWILFFAVDTVFMLWVLRGQGAEWMEGWRALLFIDWFRAAWWSAEQIRLYVLLWWICHAVWFIVGLFNPALRGSS